METTLLLQHTPLTTTQKLANQAALKREKSRAREQNLQFSHSPSLCIRRQIKKLLIMGFFLHLRNLSFFIENPFLCKNALNFPRAHNAR
jgi:hypothetical protein